MFNLAKGIRKYVAIAAATISCYSPAVFADNPLSADNSTSNISSQPMCEATEGYYPITFAHKDYCTEEMKEYITKLEISVSLKDYTLKLEGILTGDDERCTLLEQRVIVGKSDWKTPLLESKIESAQTNPYWYPTKKILAEMTEKYGEKYVQRKLHHKDGIYIAPGKDNPLGMAKFSIDRSNGILLHGTQNKNLFDTPKREYSHGCIRVEDEVELLKKVSAVAGNTEECYEQCIDELVDFGKTKTLHFSKPISIKIHK